MAKVKTKDRYVCGIDFGTDSVRALIADAANGSEIASAVESFPRWSDQKYCDPVENRFRQHPLDHCESLEAVMRRVLKKASKSIVANIVGLSVDATGSTPGPVDRNGTPLALLPKFRNNPNAMFNLWKDHTAVREAEEINTLARSWGGIDFTMYEGGIYSSEWFWAKMLHVMREDKDVRAAAFSWVENCDWLPALLTGTTDPLTMKRSRCAAGHKAMWHESFGGLPSEEFLVKLDPALIGMRERLYTRTQTTDTSIGTLSAEWSKRLGLPPTVKVGVGAIDAHIGAIGGQVESHVMLKIMGTSTCDILVVPAVEVGDKLIRGICGQVDGSVIPGMVGMEAGQSAFGDVYAWFRDLLLWPSEMIRRSVTPKLANKLIDDISSNMISALSAAADKIPPDDTGILALDWLNGRRTPDANQMLKGAVAGLSLGSDAPRIFRALVEATAFGSRAIAEHFRSEGVRIDSVIAVGGIAKKSPFVMQTVCDVMNMPIKVPRSEETCALGAAMCAATVAGIYPSVEEAILHMGQGFERKYTPRPERVLLYNRMYGRYRRLGAFADQDISH